MAADSVDFIDEDDARRVFLGILEHVAHACGTDADKHLDEIGAGNAEERDLGFTGDRPCQQGLAGARVANHQHALGNMAAKFLELGGIAQVIDQFLHFFLGFVATGDISEGHGILRFIGHPGA